MKKTSVYLTEDEVAALRRLSIETGRPQAAIVREAIAEYVVQRMPKRRFASEGIGDSGRGRKTSIADDEDRLMAGFGEDQA